MNIRSKIFLLSISSLLLSIILVLGFSEHGFADGVEREESEEDSTEEESEGSIEEEQMVEHAPDRESGEGPFDALIIEGAMMIDGTGAPPEGPVDILIEGNTIKDVGNLGEDTPEDAEVIDADGMYVMPGFVDTHAHIGGVAQGVTAEYVYKLWMAHGVTTIRDPGSFNGIDWTLHEKERSENNETVAPRIYSYVSPGDWDKGEIQTPEDAREYVRWAGEEGANGFKLRRWDPPIMEALIDEA